MKGYATSVSSVITSDDTGNLLTDYDLEHGLKSTSSVLPRKDFDRPGNNKPFHNLPDCVMKQKTLAED